MPVLIAEVHPALREVVQAAHPDVRRKILARSMACIHSDV
jgi:hypothetical protein